MRSSQRTAALPSPTVCFVALSALWACGSGRQPPPTGNPPDACAALERQATSVWNTDVQADLSFSVRIYRGDLEAADAELVVSRLNRFTRQWITAREAACRRREAGAITDDEHGQAVSCLSSALELEREVIDLARTDTRAAVWKSALLDDRLAGCGGGRPAATPLSDAGADEPATAPELKTNPFGGKKGRKPAKP
jgi:hypothetical protein